MLDKNIEICNNVEMDYYLLNIKIDDESQVDHWIGKMKFAPIFYEESTKDQILNNKSTLTPKRQSIAYLFCKTFEKINENVILISIGKNNIYFYKQINTLQEMGIYERKYKNEIRKSIPKGFNIEIIKKLPIKESPLILSSIKSNRYMQATFRKINYFGNIISIKYILTEEKQSVENFRDYLLCLSSIEFETLIAKMFEERQYFVPAYKGGFLENIDLICKKNGKTITLQIKLQMEEEYYKDDINIDFYYCIVNNYISTEKIKNWIKIKEELNECPNTKKWLNRTLDWVIFEEK